MSISNPNILRMVGAFAPSSSQLARAMTQHVGGANANYILEVGAGTGAITKVLIRAMRNAQRADVVELIPELAAVLQWRFQKCTRTTFHTGNILNFAAPRKYDVIISSLPFNAFLPNLTRAVIDHLIELANDGAVLSFFEYKGIQRLAPLVFSKNRLAHYHASRALIDSFIERYKFGEDVVTWNAPPAVVHHLRIKKPVKHCM